LNFENYESPVIINTVMRNKIMKITKTISSVYSQNPS